MGEPLDIANAYLYLASDLASYVTGITLRVDGAAAQNGGDLAAAHTGGHAADDLLVIAAGVHVGQGIVVQLGVVAGERAEQCLGVIGFDDGIAVHPLQQFQHIGGSVHLHILGRHLHDVRREIFQLGALAVILQNLPGNAVLAGGVLLPIGIALAVFVDVTAAAHLLCVQQSHNGKNCAVLGHFLFDLFSGHSCSAFDVLYIRTL